MKSRPDTTSSRESPSSRSFPDLIQFFRNFTAGVLDLVYPPKCLVCEAFQPRYLCPECLSKVHILGDQVCRRCGMLIEEPFCSECAERELYFDSARSVAAYEDPLKEAIHQFKFSGHSCLAPELAQLMIDFYVSQPKAYGLRTADVIVPVPVDKRRERERGFNQSELLARHLQKAAHIPLLTDVLVRTRKAPPQSVLDYEERLLNLQGAFAVKDPDAVEGRKVLLIDDVYTTGSTVSEAARALKEAGAAEVYVLTLARSL